MVVLINIGGKDRSFKFGLGYLGNMLDYFNMGFVELSEKMDNNPFKYMTLAMLFSYNFANKEQITEDEFLDWLELDGGMHSEALVKFREYYILSMTKNVPVEDNANKKKVKR